MIWYAIIIAVGVAVGDWLGGACAGALLLIWKLIPRSEGPPALQLALTTQWVQVATGVYYTALTGREFGARLTSVYPQTILIGLGAITAMALGIRLGSRFAASHLHYRDPSPEEIASLPTLMLVYASGVAATAALQQIAFVYPTFTQAILALSFARLALIYLILRRLSRPVLRWPLILAVLGFEVVLGFTGYFSSFKEPLLLAALVMLENFDVRKTAHWATTAALGIAVAFTSYMWMSVRTEYRQDFADEAFAASRGARLERMQALTTDWATRSSDNTTVDLDNFIDRVWAVYYPALAIERVPAVIPYTDGELMREVITHLLTPRLLFPDKPDLPSDSDLVRKYSGAFVAGIERNTSIAFGYAAESYVDFGVPLMFLPMLVFGAVVGYLHQWMLRAIAHRDLAVSVATSVFWINLYLFERSWAKMIGFLLTMLAYIGLVAWITDRWLLMKYSSHDGRRADYEAWDTRR